MPQKPTYIYKLVQSPDPPSDFLPLPERLPLSALDAQSGFIHLSTALQLPGTLKRFFTKETRVYVLRLEYNHVEKDVQWEDAKGRAPGGVGEEGIYPHLYNGGRLGKEEVERVILLTKEDTSWDAVKASDTDWLVY